MKKIIFQIIVYLLFTINCFAQYDSLKTEILQIDTLSISNFYNDFSIPVISNEKKIKKSFGKPKIKNNFVFYNHIDKKRYKCTLFSFANPQLSFVKFKNSLRLVDIFFNDSNMFIKHEKIVLSSNTTLSDIKNKFKVSYQAKYEYPIELIIPENSPKWNNFKNKKLIRIPFSTGEFESVFLFLYFIDDKLIYIEIDYINTPN